LALAVPLSRFTPLVGGGSAFFVRPLPRYLILTKLVWLAMIGSRSILMSKLPIIRMVIARAGFARRASAEPSFRRLIL
jgi:hypothetical protein